MLYNHRVLNKQSIQITCFVDLCDQFTLRNLAALIDQERHDCLWHEIADAFLDNAKVAIDQVLNHACFHDDARALLILRSSHGARDLLKHDLRQIKRAVLSVPTYQRVLFVAGSYVRCAD